MASGLCRQRLGLYAGYAVADGGSELHGRSDAAVAGDENPGHFGSQIPGFAQDEPLLIERDQTL